MTRVRALLVSCCCLVGSASPARAADGSAPAALVQLDYRRSAAAAACVSPEQLERDVEARLGRRVFAPAGRADLLARVTARRAAGAFVIHVELFDREGLSLGARALSTRAAHCSSLDDSLSLVLSLAADVPRAEAALAAPSPAPPAPAREAPASPLPRRSLGTPLAIPSATHAPRLGVRLEPTLGAALVSGLLPGLSPGWELGLTLRANAFWPVSLHGTGWAGQRRDVEVGRGARFSAQTLELGVCPWTAPLAGTALSVCALQWLGRGHARGYGFDESVREDAWMFRLGAGATLSRGFGPVVLSVAGAALVAPVRGRYYFSEGVPDATNVTVYEQPWLSLSAALRVGTEI